MTNKASKPTSMAAAFLFGSLAIGLGGAFAYEAYAVASGRTPTISQMAAGEITDHPHTAVLGAFLAGGLMSLLIAHFSDDLMWWQP